MKALIWTLGVASLIVTGPSMATAQTKKAVPSDSQLQSRIEQRLAADRMLKDHKITVAVDHRIATLSGSVDSRAEKNRADKLARTRGIVRVEDRLSVETKATTGTHDNDTRKGEKTADKVKGTSGRAASSVKEGVSKTGEVITDGWITTRVKTRFVGEDALKGSDINVDTNNHIVTLKGTVASAAGRARALELARTTEGVHSVVNQLVVAPEKK